MVQMAVRVKGGIAMKPLTKKQAVEEHRKMWRWIAEETEKQEKVVGKEEYLNLYYPDIELEYACFCCEYALQQGGFCIDCPIDWDSECDEYMCIDKTDFKDDNLYALWNRACGAENWKEAAKLAREIAELPESEEE